MEDYCKVLTKTKTLAAEQNPDLPNYDFDTGHATKLGEYPLADETYGGLIRKLHEKKFEGMTPELRQSILTFFSNTPPQKPADEDEKEKIEKTKAALADLRAME